MDRDEPLRDSQQCAKDTNKYDRPHALPILETAEKSFRINTEAFKTVLNKVGDKHFVLYSINGPSRTGKSYLFNYFIKYFESRKSNDGECPDWVNFKLDSNFPSRSGRERQTQGMLLWSEPYFIRTDDDEEVAIVLIDTQGLFDEHTTALHNAFIMSVSTLCSSVIVFNVMRLLTEDILQQLQHYSSYASTVTTHQSEEAENPTNSQLFPNLLFLLRDFELSDYEYGLHSEVEKPPGSRKNFFEDTFMKDRPRTNDLPQENKLVRETILNNFKEVSIFVLPDPGKKFKMRSDEASTQQPDEEFQEHVAGFIEKLLSPDFLVKKTVGGWKVTGKEFLKYITNWGQLCEEAQGSFPDVQTIAQTTALTQYSVAESNSFTHYKQLMDKYMGGNLDGVRESDLVRNQKVARDSSFDTFAKQRKSENQTLKDEFKALLTHHVTTYHENLKRLNQQRLEYSRVRVQLQERQKALDKKTNLLETSYDEMKKASNPSDADDLQRIRADMEMLKEKDRKLIEDRKNIEQALNAPPAPSAGGRFCIIS